MSQGKDQTENYKVFWTECKRIVSEMPLKPYKGRNVENKIVRKKIPKFMISCSILATEKEQIKSKISRWREYQWSEHIQAGKKKSMSTKTGS